MTTLGRYRTGVQGFRWALALVLTFLAGCYLSFELDSGDVSGDAGVSDAAGELPENAVVQIAPGGRHTCALRRSGQVVCWGHNSKGQLGDGTTTAHLVPVPVEDLVDGTVVAAGDAHTCAVRPLGHVACWGWNKAGQLGDGTTIDRHGPVGVVGLDDARSVSCDGHCCALRSSGSVVCWGANVNGRLGDGTTVGRTTPVAVRGLSDPVAVTAGGAFTCALHRSGHVACWGSNVNGQLGDDHYPRPFERHTPVDVVGLADATAVSAGEIHACALRASGRVMCWGGNRDGRLGNGKTAHAQPRPVEVKGLRDAMSVTVGSSHTCALRRTGEVVCWGNNHGGQLGDGSTKDRKSPVKVRGLMDATAVAAGGGYTCAIRSSGRVVCWGLNTYGQLGDGTTTHRSEPVAVKGL